MIVDVWDLMGSESFARWNSAREGDGTHYSRLRKVLVLPDPERFPNRLPLLLDPDCPAVDYLLTSNGEISPDISERTWLMRELLLPADKSASPAWQDPPELSLFRSWFSYQRGVLGERFDDKTARVSPEPPTDGLPPRTILAVPDFLGVKVQEAILSDSGFDRSRTRLLWRPVAAVLGAEELLEDYGVKDGDKVAVLDVSSDGAYFNVCVLTMKRPKSSDWPIAPKWSHLVPSRATAPERPDVVPAKENGFYSFGNPLGGKGSSIVARFDLATSRGGSFFLPKNGYWIAQPSSFRSTTLSLADIHDNHVRGQIVALLKQCKFALSIGEPFNNSFPFPGGTQLLSEPDDRNWVLRGCVRFAYRDANDLPTYYDQMEGLYQVIQAEMEERVVANPWIPPSQMAKGGETIEGKPVQRHLIAGSSAIVSHISFGEPQGDTPLKEYNHKIVDSAGNEYILPRNADVTFNASAIPGQGLATIRVSGIPASRGDVVFDLRQLIPALFEDGIEKTINGLEERMDRSYPPMIPQVESQHINEEFAKWPQVRWRVRSYLDKNGALRGDDFYGAFYGRAVGQAAVREQGLSILRRWNVFGSAPGARFPDDSNFTDSDFEEMFRQIANDWALCGRTGSIRKSNGTMRKTDLIRLAAWTYQRDNPVFDSMTEAILQKGERMSRNGDTSLLAQEYTYLANMVSCPNGTDRLIQAFLRQFSRYRRARGPLTKVSIGVQDALSGAPPVRDNWYGTRVKAETEKRRRQQDFPTWIHTVSFEPTENRYYVRTRAGLPLHGPVNVIVGVTRGSAIRVQNAFAAAPIKQWAKAVSIALMENEDATLSLSSEDALRLAETYYELMNDFLISTLVSSPSFDHHKSLFRGMMFLLKRRRFDRTFLKNLEGDTKVLFDNLDRVLETTAQASELEQSVRTLAAACRAFLNGKGHLLDLPAVLSLGGTESEGD